MKKCFNCKKTKPNSRFYRDKQKKDGLSPRCTKCLRSVNIQPVYNELLKKCPACKENKSKEDFWKNRGNLDGLQVYCKPCRKNYELAQRYGISFKEYLELLESQKHCCQICGEINRSGKMLGVDHCHKSNRIRGLLCSNCNFGLGYFRDNLDVLQNAILYLEKNNE